MGNSDLEKDKILSIDDANSKKKAESSGGSKGVRGDGSLSGKQKQTEQVNYDRLERIKKARERKLTSGMQEVLVQGSSMPSNSKKAISKEEIQKRRAMLNQNLNKVEVETQQFLDSQNKADLYKEDNATSLTPSEINSEESEAKKNEEGLSEAKPSSEVATSTDNEATAASPKPTEAPKAQKPTEAKSNTERRGIVYTRSAPTYSTEFRAKPKTEREGYANRQYNRNESGRSQDGRQRPSRPQGAAGERFSKDGRQQGGARDGSARPFNKDNKQDSRQQITTNLYTSADPRKRIVVSKPDEEAKDKENKKQPRGKKDIKTSKSWLRTINEGMDELDIEKEVDTTTTISPNIDISDLIDLDNDHRKHTHNKSMNRHHKKQDKQVLKQQFVRPEFVEMGESISLSDFSALIGVKTTELVKKLFSMGIMANLNQSIDAESAELLGMEYGVEVRIKSVTEEDILPTYEDKEEDLEKRPPIVTVMGHVDHGKTSLLDAIRSTSVVEGEAGGITQHIGAYEVECANGTVTFLDTPGHEAFTTLRARGALLTDIVILVVAADDGVKPQTKEAIDHAKAAGVRIVVAINKIDKDGANPDKVKQQLAEFGIISEEWGGEYQFQEISAKRRLHINDLLDKVLLEAEVLELKGNPNRPAEAVVIESRLDKQKGPVATVLVKNGTLKRGDFFISGFNTGKVRAMFDYKGHAIKEAGLSVPAEIMGFSELPEAGEKFIVLEEKVAKQVLAMRQAALNDKEQATLGNKLSLADFFNRVQEGSLKELSIVLKADTQGSLEALSTSLLKLSNKEVKVKIIHDGIGAINESDVSLASASSAIIIGFNVRPDMKAKQIAEREKVSLELYSVIYKAIDDVKLALEGLLSPEMKENVIGHIEIRQIFSAPKVGKIAGCFVLDGKVTRQSNVRVVRDSIVIFDGKLSSLKRFTDDVKEVVAGYECGLTIDKYQDIKEGDNLEVYEVVEEKRTLEDVEKASKEGK